MNRSDDINHIMASLAKAQGTYKPVMANEDAPGGKYANLQAILEATRESLAQNGLAIYFFIEFLDEGQGAAILKTILGHESGQWISSTARLITTGKTERQLGNMYEIHKRMHASMILGISPSKHDPVLFDDNGQEIGDQHLIDTLRKPKDPKKPDIDRTDVISTEQYNELMIELDGYEDIAKDMMDVYHIETLADLPRSEYHRARSKILKIKRTQDDYHKRGR